MLNIDWDYLIVLDACRCDVFRHVYRKFFPSAIKFRCITSLGSSTMEFIEKSINSINIDKEKDVIFVNSNPMIDHVLGVRFKKIFYKYISVWKNYWDKEMQTVRPEDMYYVTLKTYIKNPVKRMIIWFLQPHYPFIDRKFNHINALNREFMSKALRYDIHKNNLLTLIKIAKNLFRKRCLYAGIPDKICEYMRQNFSEVLRAYMVNLFLVLHYVKKLTEILLGKIVVTSDHGEAFGEPLSRLLPLPVYGHPSRIRIPSLTQVPYLEIKNTISRDESIRKAIRELSLLALFRVRSGDLT
ncbi:MAG: hypothetical protein DRJ59_02620 [Thermoprotei archaeon]|nr:MAG: hypothetical protein DRJ59_02620 [Thermoprotei archaeon]